MQSVPRFTGFGEGTIADAPVELQQEPRDIEPLYALSTALVLIELLLATLILSYYFLVLIIALLIVGFFFNRLSRFGVGCLTTTIGLPIRVIRLMWRPLRDSFSPGSSARNMRRVREYRLNLVNGSQDTFTVKGELTPRTLQSGDYVQIWVGYRSGRAYLRRGRLRDKNNVWSQLQIREAPLGLYWFIGLIVLTIGLGYLLLAYR
jgi:hypothetical protein